MYIYYIYVLCTCTCVRFCPIYVFPAGGGCMHTYSAVLSQTAYMYLPARTTQVKASPCLLRETTPLAVTVLLPAERARCLRDSAAETATVRAIATATSRTDWCVDSDRS